MSVFAIVQQPTLPPALFIAHTDIVEVDGSPGGGELSPFSCPGAGNRPPN